MSVERPGCPPARCHSVSGLSHVLVSVQVAGVCPPCETQADEAAATQNTAGHRGGRKESSAGQAVAIKCLLLEGSEVATQLLSAAGARRTGRMSVEPGGVLKTSWRGWSLSWSEVRLSPTDLEGG